MKDMKLIRVMAVLLAAVVLAGCSKHKDHQNVVYEDMKVTFDQKGLLSANIGLFTKTEKEDSVSYGECGSGVIFQKKDHMYYALTAKHVVSARDAQLLVFTINTDLKTETVPGLDDMKLLSQESYEAMYQAEVVYVSQKNDLAIIRFASDEHLSVMDIAEADPNKGDRIMCVGHPENDWFAISYGTVTSGIEKFGELTQFPSNAMKHTAYVHVGSSGGAAISETMQLVGIVPGASLSLDGKTFHYGVLIPVSEIHVFLNEWHHQ